jgi:DnaJ-class molecular chaperone
MDDPYRVLGVAKDADKAAIKAAYRKLAKQYHPDKKPGDAAAEKRFKEAGAAYDLLRDAEKRRRFDAGEIDAQGRERPPFGFGAGPGPSGYGPGGAARGFRWRSGQPPPEGLDQADLESVLSDLFGGRFGGGPGDARTARGRGSGANVRAKLTLDFVDAARGDKQRLVLPNGRTVEVNVPAGSEDGQVLRLKGQGDPGPGGGPAGDMLIELAVQPHPRFKREGLDILTEQTIPLAVAVRGGRITVPTLERDVRAKVAPNTNGGTTLRLRGRGVKGGDGQTGDLLVRLTIVLPDPPDPDLQGWAERQSLPAFEAA